MSVFDSQVIFTPQYHKLNEITLAHERAHWTVEEVDLRIDTEQWKTGKITDRNKAFNLMVMRLFTQADSNLCSAYVEKLLPIFKAPDVRMMLLSFASRETTHVRGYRLLNETLGYDSEEFMSDFLNYKEMKDKHEYMIENVPLNTPAEIALYLAKQILMEGLNVFGSFAMLLSNSQEAKLPGAVSVNAWSQADESFHVAGLSELFRLLIEEFPQVVNNAFKHEIYKTNSMIVKMEHDFIDLAHSVGGNDVATAEDYKQYICKLSDYRMTQIGLKPQYGIKEDPLPWISLVTSNTFTNFFEATSVQYSKASLVGDWTY